MTQTRATTCEPSSRTAQGYNWNGKKLRNGEYVSPTQPFAAGMLVSTRQRPGEMGCCARHGIVAQEVQPGTDVDADETQ